MNEMKKSLNKKVVGQSVPECLDGKVTHDDIQRVQKLLKWIVSQRAKLLIK